MKLHKLFLLITLLAGGCVNAFAQTSGTMIHGTVEDDIEPLMMANVVEIDEQQRQIGVNEGAGELKRDEALPVQQRRQRQAAQIRRRSCCRRFPVFRIRSTLQYFPEAPDQVSGIW